MTDWKIGDIAECVDDIANPNPNSLEVLPRAGQTFIVSDVDTTRADHCEQCKRFHILTGLAFVGIPEWFWNAKYFRKVEAKGEDRIVEATEQVPA